MQNANFDNTIRYVLVANERDIAGILELQQANLVKNISPETAQNQGFVTVEHDLETLAMMHAEAPSILAKSGGEVAGYNIAMLPSFRDTIPVLVPMFEILDSLTHRGRSLKDIGYIVCGQVCVGKNYRGMGIFEGMYHFYRDCYAAKYPIIVTEIATSNTRSLRAHARVGFQIIHTYVAPDGVSWEVVLWDWAGF